MMKVANLIVLVVSISIFSVLACNSREEPSAFSDLLGRPPYAGITDSIHRDAKNGGLYYRRGQLLQKNQLIEPALTDFEKAWSLEKKEEFAVAVSNLLLDKKDFPAAVTFIQNSLKILPGNLFLLLNLADVYKQQGKSEEALAVYNEIIEKFPGQIDALMSKSELLDAKNEPAAAIATLEQAYALAPFDADLCHNLAFKYAQNKNEKALSLCDSLIRADSTDQHAEPYYFKGVYYYNTGQKSKALGLFNQAIVHDYYFLDAYLEKGRILFEQKSYADALKVFTLATTISPAFADAYFWLGKCQEATGQLAEAKQNYLRAYAFDKSLVQAKEAAEKIR